VSQTPERRPAPRPQAARATTANAAAAAERPGTRNVPEPAGKPAGETAAPKGSPPLRLTLAAGVAAVDGLAVAGWGVAMATGGGKDILAGLLVILLAALPLGAAYGLRRARSWSRGPALIMQLLSLPIAWAMLHSDGMVIAGGAVLGALALAGLVLLVHPATTDALGIGRTASS
jgi:hypothetical protein